MRRRNTHNAPRKGRANAAARRARVLVVDDHPMVRERLVEIINAEPGFEVCGQADDRAGTLAQLQARSPDIVLLDLRLKDSHGLELLREIRARWPAVRVLVVSMHDETLFAEHALAAGADGYISKQEATRNIVRALHVVRAGQRYLGAAAVEKIVERLCGNASRAAVAGTAALSPRELKVFALIGQGFSSPQIAHALGLDRRTVETYRARIKAKLNLRSGDELLQQAIAWSQLGAPPSA
ncbi:MAG: response regulator transcription factor [Verrucomicrobiae bacterium]|nr:response regulator transcription factor [Verrucomicrobiae bacterium]MDW8307989.1 response regulator transcription factor [Verrucomicrobiales bacterium]